MSDNREHINVDTIEQDLLQFYAGHSDCYRVSLSFCHCRRSVSFYFHAYLPCCEAAGVTKREWWEWPLHPIDRQFYPEDCFNDDGTLDADKMRAQGWVLQENGATAPSGYPAQPFREPPGMSRSYTMELTLAVAFDHEGNPIPPPDDETDQP